MPKLLLSCHVVLLFCLSVVAFPAAAMVLGEDTPGMTGPAARWLGIVAVILAALLAITEFPSGVRWPPLVAVGAAGVGLFYWYTEPSISAWAWAVGWASVVLWFAVLTASGRENR